MQGRTWEPGARTWGSERCSVGISTHIVEIQCGNDEVLARDGVEHHRGAGWWATDGVLSLGEAGRGPQGGQRSHAGRVQGRLPEQGGRPGRRRSSTWAKPRSWSWTRPRRTTPPRQDPVI